MALPQLIASVIGASPYARTIRYQYTSVMIAPIVSRRSRAPGGCGGTGSCSAS